MNFRLKKTWRSGSHKDPNNRLLTDRGSKYGILLDKEAEGKRRVEKRTSAGNVVFENGMAVVPDDARGNDIAHELKATSLYPEQINYHPGREGGTLKRDHQVVFRMPAWNTRCKIEGCEREAEIQRVCAEHWRKRWDGSSEPRQAVRH